MWNRHPKSSLKVPQIQKFITFHHIYPGALLPQLPTLGHESDVVCTSVTSTSLDCLTSQTQEIALDQHLQFLNVSFVTSPMLAFQPKLKQAPSLLHSAASWLDGMEMGGRRNGEACEQDPQHACGVYMQVHIHVVYLPLRTSHTKNDTLKHEPAAKSDVSCQYTFSLARSEKVFLSFFPIVLYHSKTPCKASAWNGPQSSSSNSGSTHCKSLTRPDTGIANVAHSITRSSWTSRNQRLDLLLPAPRPGALPLPFLRGWISIAFPCLMIDTHRPRSLITTGGKENVDGHPGLTGFRFLRWHPMPLTVQDQNISMSHHDPLALNSHLPVRTQRKSELATVMDVIGTRILTILV